MLRATAEERLRELERRQARLEERLADLEEKRWVKTGTAAELLFISQNSIHYRLRKFPEIYKEGEVWRWHPTGEHRLINLKAWRQADQGFEQVKYQRLDKSKIMKREHRRKQA